jgi:NADH oxidase (H2O2-forming)
MDKKRVVIVGCGLAGAAAAESARSFSQDCLITVIDESEQCTYERSGLVYTLSGKVRTDDLFIKNRDFFTNNLRARLVMGRKVSVLDLPNHRIIYDKSGGLEGEDFDALVLATGSQPGSSSIPGSDKLGIYRLWSLRDAEAIKQSLKNAKSALVIGATPFALELSEVFLSRKLNTILVTPEKEILSGYLDPSAGSLVRSILEEEGARIICGKKIERFVGFDRVQGIILGGNVITADLVVTTGNLRPRSELARVAGLEIGEGGGIIVNTRCESSAKGVYAAGDCAEMTSNIFRGCAPSVLASIALRMGIVAGYNGAGGSAEFREVVRNSSFRVDGVDICTVGLTYTEAKSKGFECIEVDSSEYQFAFYYPGGRNLYSKLVITSSGVLIGAQFVGPTSSVWGNIAAMMIANALPISYLSGLETSFSTLTQPYWPSPVVAAKRGEDLLRRTQGI